MTKKDDIKRALKEGKSYNEIAEKYHVSKSTILRIKKENSNLSKPKKERDGPEFLSFLTFGSLLILWLLLIQGREFTIKDMILSIIFFFDAVYIFYELRKHRY